MLEKLFGQVCMQGAHNSGVDIRTLLKRLANAMDLCQIFSKHPEWDQGHCHLNYSWLESCDHIKPYAWKGDLWASTCSPAVAWSEGWKLAEVVLREHHVAADFTEVFSHLDVDTLQPLPDGNYPENLYWARSFGQVIYNIWWCYYKCCWRCQQWGRPGYLIRWCTGWTTCICWTGPTGWR